MNTLSQFVAFIAFSATTMTARAQLAQALTEQARNIQQVQRAPASPIGGDFVAEIIPAAEETRQLSLGASAEAGWSFTDNALFTKHDRHSDNYFSSTAGVNARYSMTPEWEFDTAIRGGLFRFDRFGSLDFQSFDFSFGVTVVPKFSKQTAFYSRYAFTELLSHHTQDVFYTNHAVTFGVQHSIPFSRAHGITLGIAGQWAWTDPADTQRDNYSLYAGYRLRIARALTADLLYRLDYFVYRESGDGRRDLRNSLALSLRYDVNDWMLLTALASFTDNESNRDGDYRAWNSGVNIGLQYQF